MSDPHTTYIDADEQQDDEGFAESTTTSFVTSIASNIRRGIEENGRTYASYGRNACGLPIDEDEQDRNDLQHCKFTLIYNGKLHMAPIHPTPQRILDLGTGTGIWAIDMADKYPSAEVTGVDIAAVQPSWVPPNCQFEIEDVENNWLYAKDSFDFIHAREFLFAIRDWPRLIKQAFDHLKPGGYLEIAATYPRVGCDDGTLPTDRKSAYQQVSDVFFKISEAIGSSAEEPTRWKGNMEAIGFIDVVETVFKMPTNPWPKDRRLKEIGAFELANFVDGSDAFMLRGYTMYLGGNRNELEVLLAQARRDVKNRNVHSYVYFYNVYGRKPPLTNQDIVR